MPMFTTSQLPTILEVYLALRGCKCLLWYITNQFFVPASKLFELSCSEWKFIMTNERFDNFFASNVQGNQKSCTRSYKPLHPLKCTCILCSLTEYSPVFPNQPLTTMEPFLDSKTWHQDQRL